MLLIFLAFLMKFVDITKQQPPQQQHQHQHQQQHLRGVDGGGGGGGGGGVGDTNNNSNNGVWRQHVARNKSTIDSNSSSTSSGCDSNTSSSSKENVEQNHAITPKQLQQIRHYQRLQQQQLQLLQQQLLQRRRLQQQLLAEGVVVDRAARKTSTTAALTCNQQYLIQQKQQQQQQQQQYLLNDNNNLHWQQNHYNNNHSNHNLLNLYNKNDKYNRKNNNHDVNSGSNTINNSNNNNNNNNNNNDVDYFVRGGFIKGQKFRRGMTTEFSTNNDISNNSHHSQPLQNSPHHQRQIYHQHQHYNSPQHNSHQQSTLYHQQQNQQLANINSHLTSLKQTHNHKINQQTLPLNPSSANINHNSTVATNSPTSATHSPLHYKNPLNSPNNSPFAYAYYGAHHHQTQQQQHQQPATPLSLQQQQQQQQQQLRLLHSKLSQTNYQQHLNDLLLQQQHLQLQQQRLLNAAGGANVKDETGINVGGDELSDECLKQNVAIVLNNLDRYNNALRSIILNEQASNSLFDDSLLDFGSISNSNSNNNFLACSNDGKMATAATPESDYNSNATTPGSRVGSNMLPMQQQQQQHDNVVGFATAAAACTNGGGGISSMRSGWEAGGGYCSNNIVGGNNLNCSLASSHDFSHDNSDYQWFLDYGYRDGCSMQRSVLSSLSASYNGIGELLYYEDLAKNIDANLAEVDMESFRAEDIHSLLSHLPSYCKNLVGGGASINGKLQQSLLQHQQLLPAAHNMLSQTSISSANELIDNSICKSELLFSPVKESHLSVDSLDLDAYPDDGDIILTCKANKDNYTIAFEGSVLYSDESFYAEPNEISLKNKQNYINLHSNLDDIVKRQPLDASMSRSDHQLTTWSKLKKNNATQLQRYPSGNNNTSENVAPILHAPHCTVRKSSSLPNLRAKKETKCTREKLNVSHVSTSTIDSCRSRNLLPMCQMPISCSSITASTSERLTANNSQQHQLQLLHNQQQRHHHHHHHHHHHNHNHNLKAQQQKQGSISSETTTTTTSSATLQKPQQQNSGSGNTSSGHSGTSSNNQPAFNLVKLFIKQKSSCSSSEEHASAHTCMDVSSGCWPSSDQAGSSSSSSLEQRLRKKSMNDSGKGSALSRHDEEEMHCDIVVESIADDSFHFENGGDLDESDIPKEKLIQAPNSTPRKQIRRPSNDVFYNESSPSLRRRSLPLKHPQVCHLALQHNNNNNNNNGSSIGSLQSSDASRSNSEQLMTQVYLSAGSGGTASNGTLEHKKSRRREVTSSSSEMITRSMQTSCGSLSTTRSSLSERFRFVPPSFLAKLNNLGEETQAPIYVIYPNYALPDLGFVKTAANASDVIFSPFNYKTAVGGGSATNISALKLKYTEDEILKNIDYKHVVDWKSLATLLPVEYRKRLQHIPEVGSLLLDKDISQKPLFCMTPPIRRPNRMNICDCAHYFQQQQTQQQTQAEGSSSSGSSHQPSSGYRGSSTLLTDSELDTARTHTMPDPLKQMYVYQYEQQRMDSGVDVLGSPAVCNKPTPQPRGILRKTASQGNKRNSMIEGQSDRKMTKLEKRRSLQEPPYQQYLASGGSSDELYAVLLEEEVFEDQLDTYYAGLQQPPQPQPSQRLSRKDLDARARAENFLSSLPRSELKYYAEIASILESSEDQQHTVAVQYDAAALKKEVSRALSQQKKVSFNEDDQQHQHQNQQHLHLMHPDATRQKRFFTPPNSPNISVAGGLRMPPSGHHAVTRHSLQSDLSKKSATAPDSKEQLKLSSNRFKRLQIQWELLSKDSSMMLKDLASEKETKSGGSTPTSAQAAAVAAQRSRIPRPVSYPAGKRTEIIKPEAKIVAKVTKPIIIPQIARISNQDATKTTRSPSRIVPPKRYSMTSPSTATAVTSPNNGTTPTGTARARTPTSRTSATAPNTPKRRVQSPRTIPRVR